MVSPWSVGSISIEKVFEGTSIEGWSIVGFFNSGELQKGWSEIDIKYHFIHLSARMDFSWSID